MAAVKTKPKGVSNFTALIVVLIVAVIGTVALKVSSAYTSRYWLTASPSRIKTINRPNISIPNYSNTQTSVGNPGSSSSSSSNSSSSGSSSTCSANGATITAYNGDTCSITSNNGVVTCKVNNEVKPCQ